MYVCVLVGVLIIWLYEMHGSNDKDKLFVLSSSIEVYI